MQLIPGGLKMKRVRAGAPILIERKSRVERYFWWCQPAIFLTNLC